MKSTNGEIFFAFIMSAVAATLAALIGFAGGIFLCGWLLSGEMTEWGLVFGPATALVMAVVVFVIVYRKIIHYGEPSSRPSGE